MTEASTYDAAIEIEHILGGRDAYRRAHFWFSHGDRTMARDYLLLGSQHGVAAADEDLAALEKSGDSRVAECSLVAVPRPNGDVRRPRWTRLRSSFRPMAVLALLALVLAVGVLGGSRIRPTPVSSREVPETFVDTKFTDVVVGPTANVTLAAGTHRTPSSRPSPRPSSPAAPSPAAKTPPAPNPTPSPTRTPITSAGDSASVLGPHILVSQDDGSGKQFTALVPLEEKDGWRQLRFRSEAESQFRATLWATDHTACTWRFAGLNGTESEAAPANSQDIEVAAGERRDMTVSTHGWPVLSVEVQGGDRVAGCLLVNQQFVRTESAQADQEDASPADREPGDSEDSAAPADSEPSEMAAATPKSSAGEEPTAGEGPASASPSPEPSLEAVNQGG